MRVVDINTLEELFKVYSEHHPVEFSISRDKGNKNFVNFCGSEPCGECYVESKCSHVYSKYTQFDVERIFLKIYRENPEYFI